MSPEDFMRVALAEAKQGDYPYGAVLVKNHEIVAKAHNTGRRDHDPSAHAEVNVIRKLSRQLQSASLAGYTLYTTGEPCPMCASACVWAGITEIVFSVSIHELVECGQNQIDIPCAEVIARGFAPIKITQGLLRDEGLALFGP
ncbi:nucleoside deaminase [Leptolyngbya sp. FACHB-261]|uniref:nucleoside deaminase n=1 Tax=Leptolyngbya sp. FACHB-261 TaxID=2692806 RepID=UPI001684CF8A|nr:nucleoside deaminase [Leptolyngbya sp. FACHB-261]MBD2103429.1 nucleoside deaminase [Leptolyngbya sp. FACHB-261]